MADWGDQFSSGDQTPESRLAFFRSDFRQCQGCKKDGVMSCERISAGCRRDGDEFGTAVFTCKECPWTTSFKYDESSDTTFYDTRWWSYREDQPVLPSNPDASSKRKTKTCGTKPFSLKSSGIPNEIKPLPGRPRSVVGRLDLQVVNMERSKSKSSIRSDSKDPTRKVSSDDTATGNTPRVRSSSGKPKLPLSEQKSSTPRLSTSRIVTPRADMKPTLQRSSVVRQSAITVNTSSSLSLQKSSTPHLSSSRLATPRADVKPTLERSSASRPTTTTGIARSSDQPLPWRF